ncbi:MAG TPA: carbonic anhydrase [bacterium]|jgi:carbonic anhydrase
MKLRIFASTLLLIPLALQASDTPPATVSRDEALTRLMDGNARSVSAAPAAWNAGAERRTVLAAAQYPYACIVTCSDSRVVPEIIFDESLGSLFVVRTLGNVPSADVVASVEYAVAHLHVPVVVVLGHTDCDAPAGRKSSSKGAAMTAAFHGAAAAGEAPSAVPAEQTSGITARLTAMSLLCESAAISAAVSGHQTTLISGMYDVGTGKASFETEMGSVAMPAPKATAPATAAVATAPAVAAPAVAPAKVEVAVSKPAAPAEAKAAPEAKEAKASAPKAAEPSASFARRSR